MQNILIYDDTAQVSQDTKNLLGVDRFSQVYYRKRSLERWIADIAAAAGLQFLKLGDKHSRAAIEHLAPQTQGKLTVLYVPSYIAFCCSEDDAALFLGKLSLTRSSLWVEKDDRKTEPRLLAATGNDARELLEAIAAGIDPAEFLRDMALHWNRVGGNPDLIDLRDPLQFTDYLTSNFDVRFFNSIQSDNDFVVIKRSTEKAKLKREYNYYQLLPASMQMFFIQPYDFSDDGRQASYKMERLFVPDMSLQWIHGSFDTLNFERFLDKVFYFLSIRPRKAVARAAWDEVFLDAFKGKVLARRDQLVALPEYKAIAPYIDSSFGGIDQLFSRYLALLERFKPDTAGYELCVGHGDLCFSNILYSKTTGLMRLIDPRGADGEQDLYVNPFYDVAKLSHSISGNYDFINHGLFKLEVGHDLKVRLLIEPQPPTWPRKMFEDKLREHHFDPLSIRLYEASLFLSMVPLHIDAPKKVVAFLANADAILTEIENHA